MCGIKKKSNLPNYIGLSRLVYIHLGLIGLTNCIHNLRPLRLQHLEGAIEEIWGFEAIMFVDKCPIQILPQFYPDYILILSNIRGHSPAKWT